MSGDGFAKGAAVGSIGAITAVGAWALYTARYRRTRNLADARQSTCASKAGRTEERIFMTGIKKTKNKYHTRED
eukprot:491428-Lingulodinium_polyedra.AAC.1